ncbi:hypothetical protein POM88_017942 [Heracleum sosnowskyi]|uniref:CCHC-type domain-containing protein n=1 Tax=Heracleum sosnowskyi TaxID=360622 RepID=A0AAD8MYG1_9APIA|nr:hypothetical protein POM88_017942 [Heracleum sosnowskyi]
MLADPSGLDQLAAIYAYDAGLSAGLSTKRRKQRENRKRKKMKGLELDATSSSGQDKTLDDSNSTRHVSSVALSEVNHHKTDGHGNTNSTPLITEVQSGDGSKIVEQHNNAERDDPCVRFDCGINGGNHAYRTKTEEYYMNVELGICPQLSAMISSEARMKNVERNEKEREQLTDAPIELDITPEEKGSMHVINVALPETSEAQSGDCSKIMEEYENGEKTNKVAGISPKLSSMLASEDKMKKSPKIIEKEALEKTEQFTNAPTDVTQSSEILKKNCIEGVVEVIKGGSVKPVIGEYKYGTKAEEYRMFADLSNCSQDTTTFACEATIVDKRKRKENKGPEENQNSAVACVADEQGGSILEALEATKEINTNDGIRSATAIDPGFSFSKIHEETPCLATTRGNPEIEQTEASVREVEKVFDRRDGGDIAAEIVKHGDSTKASETAVSLKLGSMKKEDNFMLRKLLRKPRYYDFPNSSLQMCHICGEDDHKAAECTMVRRKKPCYICGGFRHTAKRCSQGRECFKCGGRGHLARDCPEEPSSIKILDFCLRCGDLGHHMFICQSDYASEDLKAIKCYVCKEFGHLCCVGFKYEGQTVASCYKCGQSGHQGFECIRQEKCTGHSLAKSFCDHEVKGQFAGMNGKHNKAGQCTHESTRIERSFSDNDIIPNLAHVPL